MKKLILLLVVSSLGIISCSKQDIAKGTPSCVKSRIESFKRDCCGGARVDEYTFQGKSVFVFDPGHCGADMTSEVISEDCASLGYLGGIAGNTKINGEDFNHAVHVGITWHK